jgi:TrmH family RNA methyltransferase
MLTQRQIKLLRSLHTKKYRQRHGLFLVEGIKNVRCLLSSGVKTLAIYYTNSLPNDLLQEQPCLTVEKITPAQMQQISALDTPSPVLALAAIPRHDTDQPELTQPLLPVLADIQDPGNMGTLLRVCDWFGIHHLVVSLNTVDEFNPKVVQASMGAVFSVVVFRTDLYEFFTHTIKPSGITVLAAALHGTPVERLTRPDKMILLLGSESHGIPSTLQPFIDEFIHIPCRGHPMADSLNVAMAASILIHQLTR